MTTPTKNAPAKKAAPKVERAAVVEPEPAVAVTDVPIASDNETPVSLQDTPAPETTVVRFVCDQWAGVRLHGKDIKFEDHVFETDDPVKVGVLDAWPHARREAA